MGVEERSVRRLCGSRVGAPAAELHEANPMLGHRGVRLAITYPEIAEMQVRAILTAACRVKAGGGG